LSDADREYAQKIVGGSIKMTPQAAKRLLQMNEKAERFKIDRYNKRRRKLVEQNPELGGYYDEIKVDEPTENAPKMGETKTNAHGDTIKFNGNGWVIIKEAP